MTSREDLLKILCSMFKVDESMVEQENIDVFWRWLKPNTSPRSIPIFLMDITDWIKEVGRERGLRLFVKPAYTTKYLIFRFKKIIQRKKEEQDIRLNGLRLEHISSGIPYLNRAGIYTLDDLCQRTICDLHCIKGFGSGSILEVMTGLAIHKRSLKDSECSHNACLKYKRPTT